MGSSIIGALRLKHAIIFGYDTRTHEGSEFKVIKRIWDAAKGERVEVKNQKAYLAQYCALAACGNRKFSSQIHHKLLKKVMASLDHPEGPQQLSADKMAEFLSKSISGEVERARNQYRNNKTAKNRDNLEKAKHGRDVCSLILGTWERAENGEYTSKLKKFRWGKLLANEGQNFCFLGDSAWAFAENLVEKEYSEDMSVADGVDLMVRALKEAASYDDADTLGGDVEVLVLGPRNFLQLPLPRRHQTLDRAITFFNKGPIKEKKGRPAKNRGLDS